MGENPEAVATVSTRRSSLSSVGEGMFRRKNGKHVTREVECKCGKVFTQYQISGRFVDVMGERAANIFRSHSPEGFVPLYCRKCDGARLDREDSRKRGTVL